MMNSRIATIGIGETQPLMCLHQSHVLVKEHLKPLRQVLGIPALIQQAVVAQQGSGLQFGKF
jgi:hypothetical protein